MKPIVEYSSKFGARELAQLEYHAILGMHHSDYAKRRLLIDLFNSGLPVEEQLKPVQGRTLPFRGTETLLYRHDLPDAVGAALDRFEGKLKAPYVGNILFRR